MGRQRQRATILWASQAVQCRPGAGAAQPTDFMLHAFLLFVGETVRIRCPTAKRKSNVIVVLETRVAGHHLEQCEDKAHPHDYLISNEWTIRFPPFGRHICGREGIGVLEAYRL